MLHTLQHLIDKEQSKQWTTFMNACVSCLDSLQQAALEVIGVFKSVHILKSIQQGKTPMRIQLIILWPLETVLTREQSIFRIWPNS